MFLKLIFCSPAPLESETKRKTRSFLFSLRTLNAGEICAPKPPPRAQAKSQTDAEKSHENSGQVLSLNPENIFDRAITKSSPARKAEACLLKNPNHETHFGHQQDC